MIKKYANLIAVLILLVYAILVVSSISMKSNVYDEPGHIARAVLFSKTGYMVIVTHPPLMHDLISIPLNIIDINMPKDYMSYIKINELTSFGQEILFNSGNNPDMILFLSRIPLILTGILLGIYVFKWAKELYGEKAGLFALVIYAFNPVIIGNTPLILTDMTMTSFSFIATYYLWKFLCNKSIRNLLLTSIFFGFAQASKFTAIFFVPIFGFLMFFSSYEYSMPIVFKELFHKSRIRKILAMVLSFMCISLISLMIINLTYGFNGFLVPLEKSIKNDPGEYFDKEFYMPDSISARITNNIFMQKVISVTLNYGLSIVSYPYLKDFAALISMNLSPKTILTGGYLLGEYSNHGWWYYFILAFIIKTPIILLIFIFCSVLIKSKETLAYFLRKPMDTNIVQRNKDEIFLLFPSLFLIIYFMFHPTPSGIRYILPIFPFLFVFTSRIINSRIFSNRKIAIATIMLVFIYVFGAFLIFPDYINYYNILVGGSSNGYKYLQGYDTDAGQDIKQLSKYVMQNNISDIKLAYYGTSDPFYYLNFTCLACSVCPPKKTELCPEVCEPQQGIIAISVSYLQNTKHMENRHCFDWVRVYEPVANVGNSIIIYNLTSCSISGEH